MQSLLIVDDSRTFQRVLERILKPHYQIVALGNCGREAIALYDQWKPDLVLLDITMPNCSGKEALQAIRLKHPDARVIMVSGLDDEQTVRECLELGASAFVGKEKISAFDQKESELLKTLRHVLPPETKAEAA